METRDRATSFVIKVASDVWRKESEKRAFQSDAASSTIVFNTQHRALLQKSPFVM